jgi:peroxiredoxin family protein
MTFEGVMAILKKERIKTEKQRLTPYTEYTYKMITKRMRRLRSRKGRS